MEDYKKQPAPFEIQISVETADTDQLGHVNNVRYVQWVQDVAVAHWKATAHPEDQARLLWVVLRHEIDYKQASRPGDELTVRTWVGTSTRLKFERHTEFVRTRDSAVIVKALTTWCPVDAETLRPVSVSDRVRASFSTLSGTPRADV